MARLTALGLATVLHSVLGVSYYFLLAKCSPAPLLGSWLFVACTLAVLQAVHIFPQWCFNCPMLLQLGIETMICLFTLDLMLTKLWCRIEGLCHGAIIGVLQVFCGITEEQTFAIYEYWLLAVTTTVIGGCLLWFTLWATALPYKVYHGYADWRTHIGKQMERSFVGLIFYRKQSSPTLSSNRYYELNVVE